MREALHSFDFQVVQQLLDFGMAHPWFSFVAYVCAELLILIFPASLYVLWRVADRPGVNAGRKAVVLALLSLVFSVALKTFIAAVYLRARPFTTHPELISLPVHVDPASFPSGHALIAFTIAGSLWFSGFKKLGGYLLFLAVLVAVGRVAIGVHYPTDVLGGAAIGLAAAWFLHRESSGLKRYLPDS